ncbi:MAG: chemotaxis protein CheA [Bryobacteraceae bacterium]
MEIDFSRFRDTFFAEAAELAAELDRGVLALERMGCAGDPGLLHSIFRAAHSIKGNAGMLGLDAIAGFTHSLETLLDRLRDRRVALEPAVTAALVEASAALGQLLEAEREAPGSPPAEGARELAQRLSELAGAGGEASAASGGLHRIRFAPAPDFMRNGLDPLLFLRDLEQAGRVVAVRADSSRLPALEALDPEVCYLAWEIEFEGSRAGIEEVFGLAAGAAQIAIAVTVGEPAGEKFAGEQLPGAEIPAPAPTPPATAAGAPRRRSGSIRVDTDKADKLINLAGELVIAQAMAMSILDGFSSGHVCSSGRMEELREAMAVLGRHTREIQERVMGIRMLSASTVFGRFPRLVRDLAAATGKTVDLEIDGADTEIDRGLIEKIADPLTHLVRNAVDHGIESAERRREAGKPAVGRVRLAAFHRGGSVHIEVSDDGRGIDVDRVKQRAVERGMIPPEADLSPEQARALLFEPGFSTAGTVTGLSGRGVGLDVVRRNVEALGGRIRVDSRPGQGCMFLIALPMTLAILDGLLVRLGGGVFVIPLTAVVESVQLRPGMLVRPAGCGLLLRLRGEAIPALSPGDILGAGATEGRDRPTANRPPANRLAANRLAVVVEADGQRAALLVDDLAGQQQVVVKSLEEHYGPVDGILGATILGATTPGNSSVALIIDVGGLLRMAPVEETPPGRCRGNAGVDARFDACVDAGEEAAAAPGVASGSGRV